MFSRGAMLPPRLNRFSQFRYYCSRVGDDTTVNPSEIAKFSAQAAKWWHPNGSAAPLHRMNPTRIAYIRSYIEKKVLSKREPAQHPSTKPLNGLKIIDVGCGGGLATEPIARLGATVLGIDMAKESIQVAKYHSQLDPFLASGTNLQYRQAAAEDIVKEGEKFDTVLALEVIEHVSDQKLFLTQCAALVKPGGAFIMSTINRTSASYALGIVVAERVVKWLPPGTHDWTKFPRPDEIADILKTETDLVPDEVIGIAYNPLQGNFSIVNDTSVNYILTAVKPNKES